MSKTEKTKDGKWATIASYGWKMFARIAGKITTDQTARRLLAGQSVTLEGFTSKSGEEFDVAIRVDKKRGTASDSDRWPNTNHPCPTHHTTPGTAATREAMKPCDDIAAPSGPS